MYNAGGNSTHRAVFSEISIVLLLCVVGINCCLDPLLMVLEYVEVSIVQVQPRILVEHLHVVGHFRNKINKLLNSTVLVGESWVSVWPKHVLNESLGVWLLHEVPSLFMWSVPVEEATLLILGLSKFHWIVFLGDLLIDVEQLALSLLLQVLIDQFLDALLVRLRKSLDDNPVLEVLNNLLVNGSQQFGAIIPASPNIVILVVEVLPDPGSLHAWKQALLVMQKIYLRHRSPIPSPCLSWLATRQSAQAHTQSSFLA